MFPAHSQGPACAFYLCLQGQWVNVGDTDIGFFHLYFSGLSHCSVSWGVRCECQGKLIKAISNYLVWAQNHLSFCWLTMAPCCPPAALSPVLVPDVKSRYNHRYKKSNSCGFHVQGESDESVFTQFVVHEPQRLVKLASLNPETIRQLYVAKCLSTLHGLLRCPEARRLTQTAQWKTRGYRLLGSSWCEIAINAE